MSTPITIGNAGTGVRVEYKTNESSTQTFEFSPAPFITCDRSIDLAGQEEIGTTITINVSGTLVAPRHLTGFGIKGDGEDPSLTVGGVGIDFLDKLRRRMENVLSVPGGEFTIYCQDEQGNRTTYFSFFPNIIGNLVFQESPDNWTTTIPYSFSMTMHRTDLFQGDRPLYLESIDENWSMELVDDKTFPDFRNNTDSTGQRSNPSLNEHLGRSSIVMRLTHTLSATGKKVYGTQDVDNNNFRHRDALTHGWRNFQGSNVVRDGSPDNYQNANTRGLPGQQAGTPGGSVNSNVQLPYIYARDWIITRLRQTEAIRQGLANTNRWNPQAVSVNSPSDTPAHLNSFFHIGTDGIFNFAVPDNRRRAFNHTRQKTGNEVAGTYSVTESWLIIVGEMAEFGATDEFTISHNHNSESGIYTISIEGTITGYQDGDVDTPRIDKRSKISRAEDMFVQMMRNNAFYRRADRQLELAVLSRVYEMMLQRGINPMHFTPQQVWDGLAAGQWINAGINLQRPCLNIIPVNKSVRKQIVEGILSYTYEFNTKCSNLFQGTLMESFTTQITYPNDIYETVVIPGRQRGPLFFSANTVAASKYTLNYEIVLDPLCSRGDVTNNFNTLASPGCQASNPCQIPMNTIPPTRRTNIPDRICLRTRVWNGMSRRGQCRSRVVMVARAHYDYIREVLDSAIVRIDSDNETWNEVEGRYSGSITFTFGSCGFEGAINRSQGTSTGNEWLTSMTRLFRNDDMINR